MFHIPAHKNVANPPAQFVPGLPFSALELQLIRSLVHAATVRAAYVERAEFNVLLHRPADEA